MARQRNLPRRATRKNRREAETEFKMKFLVRRLEDWMPLLLLLTSLAFVYELIKFIGGPAISIDVSLFGLDIHTIWRPPLKFRLASNLSMPHLWDIIEAFGKPARRGGPILLNELSVAALFTFREAFVGFILGALMGLILAILLVHFSLLERALMPYVIASQTVPLIAVAPMIVIWLRAGWISVSIISAYLTFFPVTIAGLRGLKSVHPDAIDLMVSYAATTRQVLFMVRFPSAAPYLFNGFKLAASLSVIGAIVGELPSGISGGLGTVILNFNQYYISGPERLWAAMIAAGVLGIASYLLVHLAEFLLLRTQPRGAEVKS